MEYIHHNQPVISYVYGNTLELTTAIGNTKPIRKIDANHYVDQNGETHEYNKSDNRSDNLVSIKRTMKKLRRIICHNFKGGQSELWITLTYAENMQDTQQVYNDFKILMKALRRKLGKLEYVNVLEPQRRGAWHMHVMLKTDDGRPLYIENNQLATMWGKGFVKVKRLKHSDNVSAYLMAYLSDLELQPDDKALHNVHLVDGKKIEKGRRLTMYPSGMNIYRTSRGIIKPKQVKTTKEDMFATVGLKTYRYTRPDYQSQLCVQKKDGSKYTITNEYYNF